MGYAKETQSNATGREINCPYCGTNNDRDRGTCWSCGKALTTKSHSSQVEKNPSTTADMPLSYHVLTIFAYLDVVVGIILCMLWPVSPFILVVGLSMIGGGLLLFALLGIWSAVERSAVYLRRIAEDASK